MKKIALVISFMLIGFTMMAMTPNKPYVISNGEVFFCDKLVEQYNGFKLKFDNKETVKMSLADVSEFYNNGKYYQRYTIEEEGISNMFMEVVASKGNLRLVKYSFYEPTMLSLDSNEVIPGGEFSTLYLFDKDNFLIEVYDDIAENIMQYFSE